MTKKSSQIKYIGIITSVYSVRKMGSASLYRNSRKDSSVSETKIVLLVVCRDIVAMSKLLPG